MSDELLLADTVEFIVNTTIKLVVTKGELKTEEGGMGTLENISLYREGEFVTEYCRGEDIASVDLAVVRDAAAKAGIWLAHEDGGLSIPDD